MSDPAKAIASRIKTRCGNLADVSLEQGTTSPWQSLLYDGGRHNIALTLSGEGVDDALAALHDEVRTPYFAIPGHLIADIQVAAIVRGPDHASVRLDALTIET